MPLSLSLLNILFPPDERAKALTTWVMATFAGIPLGPLLGGWLLDHFAWGSVFLINVPLTLAGLAAVLFLVPLTPGSGRGRIDVGGIGLSAAGLVALTYGFVRAGEHGWADPVTYGLIGLGAVVLALFGWTQTRVAAPLTDLALLREPRFVRGAVLATMASFALMGLLFVLPQLFQAVQGADALQTGVRLLPLIGGMLVSAKLAERLVALIGVRLVVKGGFALLAAGLAWGSATSPSDGYGGTVGWEAVIGLGTGCTLPPLMAMALGALTEGRSGAGSALIQVLRQVGGTIGVAVLGTVLNGAYRDGVAVDGLPAPVAEAARGSASAAIAVADRLHLPALAESARTAFTDGMAATLWVCAGVCVAGSLLALVFLPGRTAGGTQPRESEHDVVGI
jgi:MFS family permease